MHKRATVVTNEVKVTDPKSHKVKMPNICDELEVLYMEDYKFFTEVFEKYERQLNLNEELEERKLGYQGELRFEEAPQQKT